MIPAFIDRKLLPHQPGVYIFKNKVGRVIYVGKAIDLYHRVASYFARTHEIPKTNILVTQIASAETIIVESELEALILEANLIKKYLPEFNVSLKDDKDYLYIKITKEDFPKVLTARIHDLKGSLKYFGPFPSSRTVRDTLKALRRVFPWCSLKAMPVRRRLFNKACFYYHIGQCPGACVGEISKADYRKNIFRLIKLLNGNKEGLEMDLMDEMEKAAADQKFEEAGKLKKMIQGIAYLTQSNRTKGYLENPNFLEDERGIALEELKKVLHLETIPHRIECYDISNIQGHESTGSMVVLTNGEIDKSQYRKFKIHITGRPNDVGMHREMTKRRLKHSEWPLPDLILIDGGKGQVSGVVEELGARSVELGNDLLGGINVYGIAKRMEWLYGSDGQVIKLSRHNPALKLVQKIRDEAHRFAITYHRKLHQRAAFSV